MRVYRLSVMLFVFFTAFFCDAQKIKYKDLFPLLASKQYEQAIPQLKTYLSDAKKSNEANPNLQMALWLENRLYAYDALADSAQVLQVKDSALSFFEKAQGLITEKELKKNDEYYQTFFRRDLRTGEFGIKVSDVHLDIEKKMEAIIAHADQIEEVNKTLSSFRTRQTKAATIYQSLVEEYPSYNTLLLTASDETLASLSALETIGNQLKEDASVIQKKSKDLGSQWLAAEPDIMDINKFGTDGVTLPQQNPSKIAFWDYAEWARAARSEIMAGVSFFKAAILEYITEVRNNKKELANAQKVDFPEISDDLILKFNTYDSAANVQKLLEVEMLEGKIKQQVDLQINPVLMDSSKIGANLEIYTNAKQDADRLARLIAAIDPEEFRSDKQKYKQYFDSFFQKYGTVSQYYEDMQEWGTHQKSWLDNAVDFWSEKNMWGIIANKGTEEMRIPLIVGDSLSSPHRTLIVPRFEKDQVVTITVDTLMTKGAVYAFDETRMLSWSQEFSVPANERSLQFDTISTNQGSLTAYLYGIDGQKNNLSLVNVDASTGDLIWKKRISGPKKPEVFKFDELIGELTILFYKEEEMPTEDDALTYVVIDKNGKTR